MEKLGLGKHTVGDGCPPYVIAEIGANHNGDMDLCKRTIDAARRCGADAVKFQSWSKDSLFSQGTYARNRQAAQAGQETLEAAMERYQLTPRMHVDLARYCQEIGVTFLSSVFSNAEVDLLDSLNIAAFKIASMDVNNHGLLAYTGSKGRPVILSTGMATLGETETALDILRQNGSGPVVLLHCVSIYPPRDEDVNLRVMATLRQTFGVPVGFSDHTLGIGVTLAAVALGACVIEKHFTLDKGMEGWDHAVSADPADMAALVSEGKRIFAALGSPVRHVGPVELEKRKAFRRRLVVRQAMKKGQRLTPQDAEFKRPGTGIGPDELRYVAGRVLTRDVNAGEELEWADLA